MIPMWLHTLVWVAGGALYGQVGMEKPVDGEGAI